jgi:hypothetical protein
MGFSKKYFQPTSAESISMPKVSNMEHRPGEGSIKVKGG